MTTTGKLYNRRQKMNNQFKYTIINNGTPVDLWCKVDYDYCTDLGPSAHLLSARVNPGKDCWNLLPLMTKDEREEIEEYYLDNLREIETGKAL
jgi:hypothetical protein